MMKTISRLILKLAGWKMYIRTPDVPKSIICVAPHTSNWDFIIGKLFYWSFGHTANFMIKKEWFTFPFNLIMKPMGAIPVGGSRNNTLVDEMVKLFNDNERFQFAVTPEGTRKRTIKWKKGFYHIAVKANVPIILCYLDYEKKEIAFDKLFYPTGNEKEDLLEIMDFYKDKRARFPENFALNER
jgi:1-acyl-sn-glycerol-3-phosphate acyltransferase